MGRGPADLTAGTTGARTGNGGEFQRPGSSPSGQEIRETPCPLPESARLSLPAHLCNGPGWLRSPGLAGRLLAAASARSRPRSLEKFGEACGGWEEKPSSPGSGPPAAASTFPAPPRTPPARSHLRPPRSPQGAPQPRPPVTEALDSPPVDAGARSLAELRSLARSEHGWTRDSQAARAARGRGGASGAGAGPLPAVGVPSLPGSRGLMGRPKPREGLRPPPKPPRKARPPSTRPCCARGGADLARPGRGPADVFGV
ncbi:hypothetical protein P7K49_026567 [Saguinus oedipus]|uniref:Uncharacterized protein n=1 Tax=Saguinus oedipus TaxID=9490 RepID=A0ABQ9UE05_SAGOE|nr:hypothetical protein P7K49_026567 [Saguinus oedipus]